MKDATLNTKLENIVKVGKPKSIKVDGKSVYISKKKINECKKEGGLLPLAALIPIIAGAVSATGAVAGGTAGIVKAVNDKRAADEEHTEQKRHNLEVEKSLKSGEGLKDHIKNFVRATNLEGEAKKAVKQFFRNISEVIEVRPDKEGGGLYLNPYRR
jgi:hypothetical protein